MKIGIISVAYDDFDFNKFYQNIDNYFLPNHIKTFYFFTNKTQYIYKNNVNVYYSNKQLGLFSNIIDIVKHVHKDEMELLFFCGFTNTYNIKMGTDMIPLDNDQYTSLNSQNEPTYFNFEALLDHIQNKEDNMIFGSYINNFIHLINFYNQSTITDIEN